MQERQFPDSTSEQACPAERSARRRARRAQALSFASGAALLALFLTGCPEAADLDNPTQYNPPANSTAGTSSTGGSGTAGGTGASCETPCLTKLFTDLQPCKLCHSKEAKLGDLDLESAGVTARLKDVPSKHTQITKPGFMCPTGDLLINTANPGESWLLKKTRGEQGTCGDPMPQSGMLTAEQNTCLETFVSCVAGKPIGGGTAGAGTGGTAAGTAGSSGSGGTGGT